MEALLAWWPLLLEVDLIIWVQNLNEAVCISQIANTPVKGMHTTILSPAVGK